jgi:[protein-PII] uridylyltransferase
MPTSQSTIDVPAVFSRERSMEDKQCSPIDILKKSREELLEKFLKGEEPNFQDRNAEVLDEYFRSSFVQSIVGPGLRIDKNPYAFIALGGYGRKEQCLHSDVDILIVFKKKIPAAVKELVRELIYPLWDLGLEVGYATRTMKECIQMSGDEFEVLTSLLDARFLCGISYLYSELMALLHERILRKHRRAFEDWLVNETSTRHEKYGDSSYLLEPNLKEGLGGLRDYHATLWLAHGVYNLRGLRELMYAGHLSHQEYEELSQSLNFIWTVRNWLHNLTGRKADQLYFEYQTKVADVMKFEKSGAQEGVERFLGMLHGHMELVKQLHLMFLRRAAPARARLTLVKPRQRVTTGGLEVEQDKLNFESPEAIVEKPSLLVKIFEQSSRMNLPLSTEAKRLVREFSYLIDDEFRGDKAVLRSLQHIIMDPPTTFSVLNEMFLSGIMTALIPEFKSIINHVQYDTYHVYPVDKHSLQAVNKLKRFAAGEGPEEHELFATLYQEVKRPDLLRWATLLHDIGKGGAGHDHADKGAEIVKKVFSRMNFPQEDIDTIAFLVKEHLLLVHTANRRDINDENVVIQCARVFPDVEHLIMVYLLTVADSMATGPKAWNDWSDILYRELFFKIKRILETGELATRKATEIASRKREKLLKACAPENRGEAEKMIDQMSPRYLLYTSQKDILRHIDLYRELGDHPFVWEIKTHSRSKYRVVTVCAKDRPGLFSKISGVFALNSMEVLNANIYTWLNHVALDIFTVEAPLDTLRENEIWTRAKGHLTAALNQTLALDEAVKKKFASHAASVEEKMHRKPPGVVVDNDSSNFFTIVEVYAHDAPGLLYRITDALYRCGLDVRVAKIGTKVDQVADIFYVRDLDGQKVDNPDIVAGIKSTVERVLKPENE